MLKKSLLAVAVAFAFMAGAANAKDVAKVNGEAIPQSKMDDAVKAVVTQGGKDTPELRAQIKNNLIIDEVVYQEAKAEKVDRNADFVKSMETLKRTMMIKALQADFLKKNPVSDADVKAAYDKYAATRKGKEYWTKHILVKTQAEADAALARLKKGENFEKVAGELNVDATKAKGGDLGWHVPADLIKPFADEIQKMKIGQTGTQAVQTAAGFHVIRLVSIRNATAEPFTKVKDNIKANLTQQKWLAHLQELIKKSKIEQ